MTTQLSQKELKQFHLITSIARAEAGLAIPEEKASMVFSRLAKRVRELGLPDLDAYCNLLENNPDTAEKSELIIRLTTNVTSFFRENHHFEFLVANVLPPLLRAAANGDRVRIWSAGCSSGPEPYCLAMTILDLLPDAQGMDVRVLATDIDSEILKQARAGKYTAAQLSALTHDQRKRYVGAQEPDGTFAIAKAPRALIQFNRLNLLHDWPMRHPFDVVFCRNVLIYFDQETQDAIISRFSKHLKPKGYLMLGHSERVSMAVSQEFTALGNTIYQRASNSPNEGTQKWH